jgi:hypothetical protein
MAAQHTPGPWVTGPASWERNGDVRYTLVGIKEATWADCRLIGAAPDLLRALRFIVEQIEEPANAGHTLGAWRHGEGMALARAAIAKAESRA